VTRSIWDLDARLEQAMDALRCPAADASLVGPQIVLNGGVVAVEAAPLRDRPGRALTATGTVTLVSARDLGGFVG
jgi:hypothetical protein